MFLLQNRKGKSPFRPALVSKSSPFLCTLTRVTSEKSKLSPILRVKRQLYFPPSFHSRPDTISSKQHSRRALICQVRILQSLQTQINADRSGSGHFPLFR